MHIVISCCCAPQYEGIKSVALCRSDSHTSYPREDGGEEDDYAAPDDDISKINSPRASVVSENHPPQKKQSRCTGSSMIEMTFV